MLQYGKVSLGNEYSEINLQKQWLLESFIDLFIKTFLDKLFDKNKVSLTVPKIQLVCFLPYTGKSSLDLRACLRRAIEKNILFCQLNIVFRTTCRLGNFFQFKDSVEKKSSLE